METPEFKTDEEAEAFLEQDLTESLTPDNFRRGYFEFEPKTEQVSLRLSPSLLDAVKTEAKRQKIPYQRYMRLAIEQALPQQPTS